MTDPPLSPAEIEALQRRLDEAEQTIAAIRAGEADSILVETHQGPRVFTLEEANHPYRVMVESMSEGAATVTPDGVVLYANHRLAAMLETPLERLVGSPLQTRIPEALRPGFDALLCEAMRGESRGELELRTASGEMIPVHLSLGVVDGEARSTVCLLASDLRERKRSEEVLAAERRARLALEATAEAEARFHSVLDGSRDVIYRLNLQTGRYEYVSPSARDAVGFGPEEIMALGVEEALALIHPDDLPSMRAAMRAAERSGTGEAVYRQRNRAGGYRWLSNHFSLVRDADGRPLYRDGSIRDITDRKGAEAALRESRDKYRALIESSSDFVWEIDALARYTYCSPQMKTLWGLEPASMLGRTPFDRMPAEQRAAAVEQFEALARERRPFSGMELLSYDGSGRTIQLEASGVPFFDDSGALLGYRGVSRDVTARRTAEAERRQAQEQLERSHRQLNQILESIQDHFYVLSRDWRFIFASRSFTRKVGKEPADFVGLDLWETFPRHRGTAYEENLRAAMDRGETRRFEIDGLYADAVYRMTVYPSVDGITVLGAEITDQKRSEEELRRTKDEYRRLVEGSASVILRADPDLRITFMNQFGLSFFGYAPEEIIGRSAIGTIIPESDDEGRDLASMAQDILRDPEKYRTNVHQNRRKDGSLVWMSWANMPVYDEEGRLQELVVIGNDFSRIKRAEDALRVLNAQLLEDDRRKNEFLAVLSHELRNPLAPIRNSLYVLDRAAPGGEQARRALRVIDRQVGQLTSLVNDLLDLTRITRNLVRLQLETLDLNEAARRALEDNRSLFEEAGVALLLHPAPASVPVRADATRLAQIVGNLLQNSAKFTPRGGHASVAIASAGGRAFLRVADDGAGMTAETQARLFQPFTQGDKSLERSRGGLGIGLALIRGLVEMHGGEIEGRSDGPGHGSVFTVTLPLAPAEAPEEPVSKGAGSSRRRVLVIEDNVDAAESLREVLELVGHEVHIALNGPGGLRVARETRPDLVLCDIGLPEMDGYQVARAFRTDPALRRLFLVALTGYALPEDIARAREAGFDRHLAKPPTLEQVQGLLAEVPGGEGPA